MCIWKMMISQMQLVQLKLVLGTLNSSMIRRVERIAQPGFGVGGLEGWVRRGGGGGVGWGWVRRGGVSRGG